MGYFAILQRQWYCLGMALTPDKLTQRFYSENNYHITKTESYNAFTQRRSDLLGFIDYIAFNGEEIIGVQTTSWSNHTARVKKILGKKSFLHWIECPTRKVVVQSWKKQKGRWVSREQELTKEDYDEQQAKEKEKPIDTTTDFYKSLFPNGH